MPKQPRHALELMLGVLPLSALALLGVAPEDHRRYSAAQFRCFDGSGPLLPGGAVNDDFCDCADGSDEPGTGACAGQEITTFFCSNVGSTPRRLFASRVGDGICDCCDGSDERAASAAPGRKACPDTCAEQGQRERKAAEIRATQLRQAIKDTEAVKAQAMTDREAWRAEIQGLRRELPALEAAVEAARAAADAQRAAEKRREEEERQQREAAKDGAAEEEKEVNAALGGTCSWRQTGECSARGGRQKHLDGSCSKVIVKGASGFCDCNGNDALDPEEPEFDCSTPRPSTCARLCKETFLKPPADKDTPQVSEYAKWMDGAEGALKDEQVPAQKVVSEYTKWMDGGEEAMKGQDAPAEAAPATVDEKEPEAPAQPAEQSAIEIERAAKQQVSSNKDKTKELQDKIDALPGDSLRFAGLMGQTLSKKVGEFNYQATFFTSAKQGHTSLGRWSGWTGPTRGEFTGGQGCWDGPQRKLKVEFVCEAEPAMLDVFEPSKCVYEATVGHPGACDPAELEMLTSGTRVIGPREEL